MDYVTDSHAILWHLFTPHRLGSGARAAFRSCDSGESRIHIPAVVIAEMIMVTEKGRLAEVTIPHLFTQLDLIRSSTNYVMLPLFPETVIASHAFTAIPDIFDRLIVADARGLGVPLLSRDGNITASGLADIVWD